MTSRTRTDNGATRERPFRRRRYAAIGSSVVSLLGASALFACTAEVVIPGGISGRGNGTGADGGAAGNGGIAGTGVGGTGVGGGVGGTGVGGTGDGGSAGTGIGGSGTDGSAGTGSDGSAGTTGTGGVAGTSGTGGVAGSAGTNGTGGVAGTTGTGGAPACTGKRGVSGTATRTAMGLQYIVHGPPGLDGNTPVPLLFIAHGFTMSGALMQSITGYDAVADREKFIVVYPNGHGANPWNVGANACAPGSVVNNPTADSFGYYEQMKTAIEADQCINSKQVFVSGFSMGGYFSNHMGCQKGNVFARAVGPHSGGTYPGNSCPGAPVPIFIMHGDADTFIHFQNCGAVARDYWVTRNKCQTTRMAKPVTGGSCDWNQGCDPNGQTVFCLFRGVAHGWAPGATEASWSFFKQYL